MQITEYPAIEELTSDNVLIVDGNNGTKQILVTDALLSSMNLVSAELHRNIFRGKNLGTSLTTAQLAAIQAGTFDDLWLGDYWVINGYNWRIVDFDYWYRQGDTSFTNHHLAIMPDTILYSAQMNSSNITEGGYVGSEMYTTNIADAKTAAANAFGSDQILSHREYLTNAVTSGYPTAGAWYDSTVELPNEIMMYGCYVRAQVPSGGVSVATTTVCKTQLALMRVVPRFINPNRQAQWLRDVASSASFAAVSNTGGAYYGSASNSCGVRPVFAIG